jgi:hypothetical protein
LSRLARPAAISRPATPATQRDAGAGAPITAPSLRGDPKNASFWSAPFLSVLAEGDVEEAVRLADQVVKLDKNDRIARS